MVKSLPDLQGLSLPQAKYYQGICPNTHHRNKNSKNLFRVLSEVSVLGIHKGHSLKSDTHVDLLIFTVIRVHFRGPSSLAGTQMSGRDEDALSGQ